MIECQIKVGSHCMSDQLQGERRKLTALYEALVTSEAVKMYVPIGYL